MDAVALPATDQQVPVLPFFIVGVGASAGGLEALQDFFSSVEPEQGIAYVVVQHLSPDFKSMMVELLSRHTKLDVREVLDGVEPVPESVYLIPPNQVLVLKAGKLRVRERVPTVPALPINVFLESLAAEQGDQSAAVILSGTGTDGTHGVRVLKEAGGVVLAQEPASAKFDGMPNSVINADLADFVAPPDELASRLLAYVKHPMLTPLDTSSGEGGLEVLTDILRTLRQSSRFDFTTYKEGTVVRRIKRRASLVGKSSLEDYLALLQSDAAEADQLVRELMIGVTQFFRDTGAWQFIESTVIPGIVNAAEPNTTLRLWTTGCATGEEAYTLAMLMEEQLQRVDKPVTYRLFATDARRDSLAFARLGVYPLAACSTIPAALRERYFDARGETMVAKRLLRDAITFAPHDVTADPPFTQLDLLTCRNMLIYFKPEAQQRVIARFRMALKDSAYLFLGSSESVGDANPQFRSLHAKANVFVAQGSPSLERALLGSQLREHQPSEVSEGLRPTLSRATEVLYEAVLKRYVPPGVAVDAHFDLLQVFGDIADMVQLPAGKLTTNLLRMVPQQVSVLLNSAGRKALTKNEEVKIPEVEIGRAPHVKMLSMRLVPFDGAPPSARCLLVFFEDVQVSGVASASVGLDLDDATRERLRELEDELVVARENLHSAVQDLEASNEELQATNEELTASNEELQSTNEELQSVNEELYTVNSEYQQKIGELEELNDDLENVLRATEAGVLFLDDQFKIRRFNETVRRLLPVRHEDIGRPLAEIAPRARYPDMSADARSVLESGEPSSSSVPSPDGAWWDVGMRVFQAPNTARRGVIVTIHEVTELKRTVSELERLARTHQMAEDIAGAGHAILDLTNEVVHYSAGARTLLGLASAERVPLSTALEMFGDPSKENAKEALDLLKMGLDIPFTVVRHIKLIDGSQVKVRMQVQGKVDTITEARLVLAVFQQVD